MARGHIAEKGSRFYVVVDLGRDEMTGKRRRHWSRGFTDRGEAERHLTALLHQLDGGDRVDSTELTVATFLQERWLPVVEASLAPTTRKEYPITVSAYIVPYIGQVRLDRLDATMIDKLYVKLRTEGGRLKKGLSPKTVRNVHGVLSSALTFAVRKGLLNRNPVDRAETPTVGRPDVPEPWTAAEVATFLDHVAEDRLAALWWLAAFTGLRKSEAIGLGWANVDLEAGSLAVTHKIVEAAGGPVRLRDTKTATSRRRIALDEATVAKLKEHRVAQVAERLAWGEGYTDEGLVFCREDGSALSPAWVGRRFAALVTAAGVRRITYRDLRHVWPTLALTAGTHPKVVQGRLGHSSVKTTLDVYSHVIDGLDRDAAETVAQAVADARSSTRSSTRPAAMDRDETAPDKVKAIRDKA